MNQPGPDRIRSARQPISALAIVADFIGSGTRIRTMLDKFWKVPSVRAWVSRGWVEFMVVAAAGTSEGMQNLRSHRLKPRVLMAHVAPTVFNFGDRRTRKRWKSLIRTYGPKSASNAERYGFQRSGALIAFNYRIPNNTPLLCHQSGEGWRALYTGPAPEDLRAAFGLEGTEQSIQRAAAAIGVELAPDLSIDDAKTVLTLSAVRGRWRRGAEIAIAETTGLTVPEVLIVRRRARKAGLLTARGRLTDAAHVALQAGTRSERKRPDIPTSTEPYYPGSLRVPTGAI